MPPKNFTPDNVIAVGSSERIDNVTLEYRLVKDAESENMMTIYIPELKVPFWISKEEFINVSCGMDHEVERVRKGLPFD